MNFDLETILLIFVMVLIISLVLRLFLAITKVLIIVVCIALLLGLIANFQKDNISSLKEKYGISLETLLKK